MTRTTGACITDVVDYRPIPCTSATAVDEQISVIATLANIVIVNGAAAPDITSGFIVLEYLKN
jgi:hypothetical protein